MIILFYYPGMAKTVANCPHCGGCLLLSTAVTVTPINPEQILQALESAVTHPAASTAVPPQIIDAAAPPTLVTAVQAGCQPANRVPA